MRQPNDNNELSDPNNTSDLKIYLVPLDGISSECITQLSEDISAHFADSRQYNVGTLAHHCSPANCLNDAGTRLRAAKLIHWLEDSFNDSISRINPGTKTNKNTYIIGVTNRDISTSVHGHDDYGILGLSYLSNHNASIVSTYRLKNKNDLWKLAFHEFCHGYYGCPHCPADDKYCIMADAKGGNPNFEIKETLCDTCAKRCTKKN